MKISVMAAAAVLCCSVVRRGGGEFALILALTAGAGILLLTEQALEQIINMIARMTELALLDEKTLKPVIKTVALSILTKITVEICRSGGEGGIAAFVETAGTILALGAALPLAEGVLELMGQMLV